MINPYHDITSPLSSGLTEAAANTALLPADHDDPDGRASRTATAGPGTILRGRYVLERELGRGGMGTVYRALDRNRHDLPLASQHVAVKVLRPEFAHRPDALQALRREAHQAQSLSHPGIVNVFDFDRDGDVHFITMELLEGELLGDLVKRTRPARLPRETANRILRDLGLAVAYAHGRGVLHMDLKPGNVMITTQGEVRVLDFGLAHPHMREPWIAEHALSFPAATTAYASCERLEGAAPDVRDDVFSFACVAYELLSGEHPFGRRSALEARDQRHRPRRIRGLPRQQWRTLQRGLAWKRYDRLRSIGDLLEGLGLTDGPQDHADTQRSRRPRARGGISQWWLVPAVSLILGAGLYLAWAEWGGGGRRERITEARHPPALPPARVAEEPVPASVAGDSPVEKDIVVVESVETGDAPPPADVAAALALTPSPAPVIATADPGRLQFAADTLTVSEADSVAELRVLRRGGSDGTIHFYWRTADDSARDGQDYAAQGPVRETLEPGQTSATLLVPLVSDGIAERTELFDVYIGDPDGGATLGAISQVTVILVDDD